MPYMFDFPENKETFDNLVSLFGERALGKLDSFYDGLDDKIFDLLVRKIHDFKEKFGSSLWDIYKDSIIQQLQEKIDIAQEKDARHHRDKLYMIIDETIQLLEEDQGKGVFYIPNSSVLKLYYEYLLRDFEYLHEFHDKFLKNSYTQKSIPDLENSIDEVLQVFSSKLKENSNKGLHSENKWDLAAIKNYLATIKANITVTNEHNRRDIRDPLQEKLDYLDEVLERPVQELDDRIIREKRSHYIAQYSQPLNDLSPKFYVCASCAGYGIGTMSPYSSDAPYDGKHIPAWDGTHSKKFFLASPFPRLKNG